MAAGISVDEHRKCVYMELPSLEEGFGGVVVKCPSLFWRKKHVLVNPRRNWPVLSSDFHLKPHKHPKITAQKRKGYVPMFQVAFFQQRSGLELETVLGLVIGELPEVTWFWALLSKSWPWQHYVLHACCAGERQRRSFTWPFGDGGHGCSVMRMLYQTEFMGRVQSEKTLPNPYQTCIMYHSKNQSTLGKYSIHT